jgi:hypothetical protein
LSRTTVANLLSQRPMGRATKRISDERKNP